MVKRRVAAYVKDMKAMQADKIKEIGHALVESGFTCLNQQANALGISRSTAWTILNAKHKTSGLSAAVINQMLMAPQLPSVVRAKLFEYIEDKIAGIYCHSPQQVRRFAVRLTTEGFPSNSKMANGRSLATLQLSRFASFDPESTVLRELGEEYVAPQRMRHYPALSRSR